MKFLVYTVEPKDGNATLSGFEEGVDRDIARVINQLREMDLDRVVSKETSSVLVRNIEHSEDSGVVTGDLYKQTNRGKALHQLSEGEDGVTFTEIISEHEDAFIQGQMGLKRVDGELRLIIEADFGSYFVTSSKGLQIRSEYSADSIRSIEESDTIGETTLDFADDVDLTASLFKPPEDEDIRQEQGFGKTNLVNRVASLITLSQAHRISMDIDKDTWLGNIDAFEELIDSSFVKRIRIKSTTDGTVRLGEGGDKAIREKINTTRTDKLAVQEAFRNYTP